MASSWGSENRWNHDVFLSFRGPDTRNTFTGHLHQALDSKGINVFIDTELHRGEVITSQLLTVIEESRISIIILSEKYASSSFCLDELVKILECRESKGQSVLPVFYHVDPTDVEEQTGTFGQEFAKLESQLNKRLNYWKLFLSRAASILRCVLINVCLMWPTVGHLNEERNNHEEATEHMDMVLKWTSALTEVARLSGWHLKMGDHESNIIQDIVKKVSKKLDYTPLHVADHPVGLDSRVEYIIQKLNMESLDVCMIGLHGMGGVGKTTTAAALYNTCVSRFEFEGCCFLSKVREESKKKGIAKLQKTLLSEILGDQVYKIENSKKGIELIKRRLRNKKVLIVVDDVDHREQLQQLVGGLEWFGGGSLIIITTRDSHLLELHRVTMIHEVKELEIEEALQLFSWYAFKKPQPDEAYMEFSCRVLRYAKCLPLALIVLGSTLYGRDALEWKEVLKKLKRCPNDEIIDVLKISYDSLDREEQAIFLDIASVLEGRYKDEVIKFIDACGFAANIGVKRLIEKSLVYVQGGRIQGGKLEMHDLLEEMATQIAVKEASHLCIRKREDIPTLFSKDKSPHSVECILFDFDGEEEEPLNLSEFTKLRILVIRNGRFTKVSSLPNNLKCLEWRNFPLNSIPPEFLPKELVVLNMPDSSIMHLEKSVDDNLKAKKFMNLTHMNFSGCSYLREIDDLSGIPNLEVMNLNWCGSLKRIDVSIGNSMRLQELNLIGCYSLTSLPSLEENQSLVSIDLWGCAKLENLPNLPTTLTRLDLGNAGIKEIPLFIGNLINLEFIEASGCENLMRISNSIYKLPNIRNFGFRKCPNLSQFPEAESSMISSNRTPTKEYYWVDLSRNKFVSLPMNTFKFIHFTTLKLNNCKWLVEIPELPQTLRLLQARNCRSLVRFSQFQFGDRFEVELVNCHKIGENERESWREMVEKVWTTKRKEDFPSRTYYSTIIPGNEIPEWFSHAFNCEGIEPSFKLPSTLLNANFIGISFCAIFHWYHFDGFFEINFSMNEVTIDSILLDSPLESEHMWLGFCAGFDLSKLLEAEEILCEFVCYSPEVVLKRMGLHFIYKK